MAERLPFTLLPGQEDTVISFLNKASNPQDITGNQFLIDDGSRDYSIGEKVAANLINAKSALMGGRYRDIGQVLDVKGVGHDKVRDMISSFWRPAAAVFNKSLFANKVLMDNWRVEHWSFDFLYNKEEFNLLANSQDTLREFVVEKVRDIVQKRYNNYTIANLSAKLLQCLPIEQYNVRLASSHIFAIWWYSFDQDNWFSFDRILAETTAYVNYYQTQDINLVLFKGFENGGTLAEAATADDLPVMINHGERRITLWAASLFD